MIRVAYALEPQTFDATVREPGLRAVAELVGEKADPARKGGRPFKAVPGVTHRDQIPTDRLPTYWRKALEDLSKAYHRICSYSCFYIHEVTGARSVDHMAPKSQRWDQAYEWTNYRLACALLNARKNDFGNVLDPLEVQDGWFVLELVGFQVLPAPGLTAELRQQILDTCTRLGLNDDLFCERREKDATAYWEEKISFAHLMEESPFVAREIDRQGRRRPVADVARP